MWQAIIGLYVTQMIGWQSLIELLPHELGGFLAGAAAPLAFLWMVLAFQQRGVELNRNARALQDVLADLSFPSPDHERRLAAITGALRRQSEALEQSTGGAAERAAGLQQVLTDKTHALTEATQRMARELESARALLQSKSAEITQISQTVAIQNQKVEQLSRSQAELLTDASIKASTAAQDMALSLDNKLRALDQSVARANIQATNIATTFTAAAQELVNSAEQAAGRTQTTSDTLQRGTVDLAAAVERTV